MTVVSEIIAICGGMYGVALCIAFLRQGKSAPNKSVLTMKLAYKGYFYIILSLYWFCLKLKFGA